MLKNKSPVSKLVVGLVEPIRYWLAKLLTLLILLATVLTFAISPPTWFTFVILPATRPISVPSAAKYQLQLLHHY